MSGLILRMITMEAWTLLKLLLFSSCKPSRKPFFSRVIVLHQSFPVPHNIDPLPESYCAKAPSITEITSRIKSTISIIKHRLRRRHNKIVLKSHPDFNQTYCSLATIIFARRIMFFIFTKSYFVSVLRGANGYKQVRLPDLRIIFCHLEIETIVICVMPHLC